MTIWTACLLTVALETTFLASTWCRRVDFLILCAAVNAATNLTLNLLIEAWGFIPLVVLLLELGVLGVEYTAYALAFGRSKRLFFLTLAANLLSYTVGGLLFGFT